MYEKALELIKRFEGCKLKAYYDTGGLLTIGYGDTHNVTPGLIITQKEAEDRLFSHVKDVANSLRNVIGVSISSNQFDALISFTYNLGIGALKKSTLLKKIKKNSNDPLIRNEFMKWVYDNGVRLNGLVKRREAESELYFSA